jgi:hypothetical protein
MTTVPLWNQQTDETPDDRKCRINNLIQTKLLQDDRGCPDYFESWDAAWEIIEKTKHLKGGHRWQFDDLLEYFLNEAYEHYLPGAKPKMRLDYIAQLTPEIITKTAFHLLISNKEYFELSDKEYFGVDEEVLLSPNGEHSEYAKQMLTSWENALEEQ